MGLRTKLKKAIKKIIFKSDQSTPQNGSSQPNFSKPTTSIPKPEETSNSPKPESFLKPDPPVKEAKPPEPTETPLPPPSPEEPSSPPKEEEESLKASSPDVESQEANGDPNVQDAFSAQEIASAVAIYSITDLFPEKCENCGESSFGNWHYEDKAYICTKCGEPY